MIASVPLSAALPAAPFAVPAFHIGAEATSDAAAREALLDRAMGPGRRRKASEAIRRGRLPAEGLALVARTEAGGIIGSVRLWHVAAGDTGTPALLLGPLAVLPELAGCGVGSALMRRAVAEAHWRGHAAILLVGDPDYYARFGFSAAPAAGLAMPGPFERHRLLGLELAEQALAGTEGLICPTGRKAITAGRHAAQTA
ncbi:GNAT family N-acetyltransferase [Aureimonas glaciei]|uniref:N-acetyltransferase n=1 Tax=Aureimonas glaciei TaxID=1776957 RepID=A0A916Y1A1_9HYPH|nr:N-acetyltransferase [Aureimonas glaciei]GGD26570.1 N-acetyltransferase [Aureimonas glaciei]